MLVENGLMMIKDSTGVTYIAMDYENLNYVIKLLEEGKYDKKKIKKLKRISSYWQRDSRKKDQVIEEQNKKIHKYIEIRVEQDKIIADLKQNVEDLKANLDDCETQKANKDKEIQNKDAEIETKDKKIKRKNRTIGGMIVGYVAIGVLVILSVL